MDIQQYQINKRWRSGFAGLMALAMLLVLTSLAQAEDVVDPARIQQSGNYRVEFLTPVAGGNYDVETDLPFRFRVTDTQGQPVNKLGFNLIASRDYSGQVKKEHNGPRTPNIGPLPMITVDGSPGEYQTTVRFGVNGHWFIQLDGGDLPQKVRYRLPIGAAEDKGAGVNLDWLVWVGVLVTVLTIVAVIGKRGEVFPTPADELQSPIPAPFIPETFANTDELVRK